MIVLIRGSERRVAGFKSESRPASLRNRWPASYWNAWPASSESAPKIGIGDNEARFGIWDRHARWLFVVHQSVQMIMPRIDARRGDGGDFLLRQLARVEAATIILEPQKILILVRRDEIAGDRAMARHRNRLALGQHAVAAEIAGEL